MIVKGIRIDDTFAEAFRMRATAVVITADSARWARQAALTATGFGHLGDRLRVRGRDRRELSPRQTPDRRPGVRTLLFAVSTSELQKQLQNRVGQCSCSLPAPPAMRASWARKRSSSARAALLRRRLADFKRFASKHYWRRSWDGESVCEATTGLTNAVGGGNLLIMGRSAETTLAAAEAAAKATAVSDVIMPFPGGIVRSGSKVGSKYKAPRPPTRPIARRCGAR